MLITAVAATLLFLRFLLLRPPQDFVRRARTEEFAEQPVSVFIRCLLDLICPILYHVLLLQYGTLPRFDLKIQDPLHPFRSGSFSPYLAVYIRR